MKPIFFQETGHSRDQFLEGAQGRGETILCQVKLCLKEKWISEAQLSVGKLAAACCTEMLSPIYI